MKGSARSNALAVFDVAARKEIKRVKTGGFPVGVLIEPDGLRAYVAYTADSGASFSGPL